MPSEQALDCGKRGGRYGKRGGRPSSKGQPLGMATPEYDEIIAFLNSQQSAPVYPSRMVGGSSRSTAAKKMRKYSRNKNKRKDFRKKCKKFTIIWRGFLIFVGFLIFGFFWVGGIFKLIRKKGLPYRVILEKVCPRGGVRILFSLKKIERYT